MNGPMSLPAIQVMGIRGMPTFGKREKKQLIFQGQAKQVWKQGEK